MENQPPFRPLLDLVRANNMLGIPPTTRPTQAASWAYKVDHKLRISRKHIDAGAARFDAAKVKGSFFSGVKYINAYYSYEKVRSHSKCGELAERWIYVENGKWFRNIAVDVVRSFFVVWVGRVDFKFSSHNPANVVERALLWSLAFILWSYGEYDKDNMYNMNVVAR